MEMGRDAEAVIAVSHPQTAADGSAMRVVPSVGVASRRAGRRMGAMRPPPDEQSGDEADRQAGRWVGRDAERRSEQRRFH
jgi:hypothetical protein